MLRPNVKSRQMDRLPRRPGRERRSTMRPTHRWLPGLVLVAAALAGCAGGPLTTRERATLDGAVLGAGTGAVIGHAVGNARAGALIGAGIGMVTGAVVGDAIQGATRGPAPPVRVPLPPPPPWMAPLVISSRGADPTRGVVVNQTPWRITVDLDGGGFVLGPGETRLALLDVGVHRLWARAEVDTHFGPRTVGWVDHTIHVDPRKSGWTVRLGRWNFR